MATGSFLPKILIVDDDHEMSEVLYLLLRARFEVHCASDGVQGLKESLRNPPALILLDLKMPHMDGFQACELIRSDQELKEVPIIVVSGYGGPDERERALQVGATRFVSKPFVPQEILDLIDECLSERPVGKVGASGRASLELENFRLDTKQRRGFYLGHEIRFSYLEAGILTLLMESKGSLVTREEILKKVWGQQAPSQRVVDAHIVSLRSKLSVTSLALTSVYGKGYILKVL